MGHDWNIQFIAWLIHPNHSGLFSIKIAMKEIINKIIAGVNPFFDFQYWSRNAIPIIKVKTAQ